MPNDTQDTNFENLFSINGQAPVEENEHTNQEDEEYTRPEFVLSDGSTIGYDRATADSDRTQQTERVEFVNNRVYTTTPIEDSEDSDNSETSIENGDSGNVRINNVAEMCDRLRTIEISPTSIPHPRRIHNPFFNVENCSNDYCSEDNSNAKKYCSFCKSKKNIINLNGFSICKNCKEKLLDNCSICEKIFDKNDIFVMSNKKMCYNCLERNGYRFCNTCKKWKNSIYEIKDVGFICKECFNDSLYFKCKECHIFYKRDRYGINNTCINCTNNKLVDVNNYSFKPLPKFYSKRSKNIIDMEDEKLFFGVELEMGGVDNPEAVNDFASDCSSNFFYMKRDTSIPVYGCEVVTQPATLQKHIEMTYWESMLKSAKDHGLKGDLEKCGVHVHISRNVFTNNECAKMDCFINQYQNFWKKIARRESHYSAYLDKNASSWGMQVSDRRCALNLSNQATIEVRIFRGTIDYKILMAYIEVCHALSIFAKTADIKDIIDNKDKTLNLFKEIVNSSNYKFLPQYCENYNIFS